MCVFVLFGLIGLIGLIERNNQLGLNSGGMRNKGGVKLVSPLREIELVRVERKERYHFSFGKEKRGERGKREKSVELEEEGHFSRGKGLISHDYGCMWFYAMGRMYV